jgi:hypothetical protein
MQFRRMREWSVRKKKRSKSYAVTSAPGSSHRGGRVLLWLVNRFIPMQSSIKSILNGVVVIAVVLWLLNVFGLFPFPLTQFTSVRELGREARSGAALSPAKINRYSAVRQITAAKETSYEN